MSNYTVIHNFVYCVSIKLCIHTSPPYHTHTASIHSILQSDTGKLWLGLLHPGHWQLMTKLDLTMVSMCSKFPGRAMTTFAINWTHQPLVCVETISVSQYFPLEPSADMAVILTREIPITSGTRVVRETQAARCQEQRRDIHGFWDQTGRSLTKTVRSWKVESGFNPSVLELDKMKLATHIELNFVMIVGFLNCFVCLLLFLV